VTVELADDIRQVFFDHRLGALDNFGILDRKADKISHVPEIARRILCTLVDFSFMLGDAIQKPSLRFWMLSLFHSIGFLR